MTISKSSLRFVLTAAIIIGAVASSVVLLIAALGGSSGIPQSLAPLIAALPLASCSILAIFLFSKVLKPINTNIKDLLESSRKGFPGQGSGGGSWNSSSNIMAAASGSNSNLLGSTSPIAIDNDTRSIEEGLMQLNANVLGLIDQIRETKKREKSVIENTADVICVIDINARVLQVNQAAKSVWGYSPEEITGNPLSDFLVKEDIDNTLNNVLGAEKSIDRLFFENRFKKKSGEIIDLLWSAHWSVSDGGLFCVAHDITQRKKAEQLLRESEERIRGILENLPAGVLVVNRAGLIEFINDPGSNFIGLDTRAIKGKRASEILSFCKEPFTARQLDDIIGKNESAFDAQITRENGERFAAEISLSKFQLSGEKCYLVIFLDVTHKHEIELAKREFVTMVSHDLRTPLTSILSILSFLESGHGGQLNEKGASLATRGRKESERLILLIRDLLDLEKMKAGKFSMHFTETDTSEVVKSAMDAVERHADLHKVKLEANVETGSSCYCDGARIIQVLVNLLDNAIKFSPPHGTVTVKAQRQDQEVCIDVANKGREIPAQKLNSIFERFEQVEESDAKEKKGSGLGLAICKTIVEQHSGKMWASSSAKDGTKFSFTLPAKPASDEAYNSHESVG